MADLVITCAHRSQVIIETHSENFILRLRRRIAEGLIARTDVALVYLDEARHLIPIALDATGGTDDWPSGVFESDIKRPEQLSRLRCALCATSGAQIDLATLRTMPDIQSRLRDIASKAALLSGHRRLAPNNVAFARKTEGHPSITAVDYVE
jgi:hypothetical protein